MENEITTQNLAPRWWQKYTSGLITSLPLIALLVGLGNFFLLTRDQYRDSQKDVSIEIKQLQERDKSFDSEIKERIEIRNKERDEFKESLKQIRDEMASKDQLQAVRDELLYQRKLTEQILMNTRK